MGHAAAMAHAWACAGAALGRLPWHQSAANIGTLTSLACEHWCLRRALGLARVCGIRARKGHPTSPCRLLHDLLKFFTSLDPSVGVFCFNLRRHLSIARSLGCFFGPKKCVFHAKNEVFVKFKFSMVVLAYAEQIKLRFLNQNQTYDVQIFYRLKTRFIGDHLNNYQLYINI